MSTWPGDSGFTGGTVINYSPSQIEKAASGRSAPIEILTSVRVGAEKWVHTFPAGVGVELILHCVDAEANAVGQDVFDVYRDGKRYLAGQDTFALSGQPPRSGKEVLRSIVFDPTGTHEISFDPKAGNVHVAAISWWEVSSAVPRTAEVPVPPPSGGGGGTGGGPSNGAALTVGFVPGTAQVTVNWIWTGTVEPTGWIVSRNGVDSDGTGAWSSPTLAGSTRSFTFTKLIAGTYTFTITPVGGTPTTAPLSGTSAPAGVTVAPITVTVTPGVNQLAVSWSIAGSNPTSFTVSRDLTDLSGAGPYVSAALPGDQRALNLTNIDPAKTYHVTVTGADGNSATTSGTPLSGTAPSTGSWLSGAGGDGTEGAHMGEFGTWRGDPITIVGNWANDNNPGTITTFLTSSTWYGSFAGAIDQTFGGIGDGESWAQAAAGQFNSRWIQQLQAARSGWGARVGVYPYYLRFAHEHNGTWFPWSVNAGSASAFVAAWKIFYGLKQIYFPEAKLVWCLNKDNSGQAFDSRITYPGPAYVDVHGVDYYNQFNWVNTDADFAASILEYDFGGAPKGLERHRQFAELNGKPLGIGEWGTTSNAGPDAPNWIHNFHSWVAQHAGNGPGNILYEIYFNVKDSQNFWIYAEDGSTSPVPASAAQYRTDF